MATRKTTSKKTATKARPTTKTATKTATKPTAKKTTAKKTTAKKTAKTATKKTATKTTTKTAAKTTAKKTTAKKTTATKPTSSKTLTTGTTAPAFTLPTDTGTVSLSQLRGKNVVLYFYPKDDTPGCTTEACNFRDSLPKWKNMNATVIGVSMDSTASHKKFKAKYKLPFTLAADTTGEVCKRYGVIGTKNMYGKTYQGIIRTTFLIDTTGTIRAIWRNVSVTGHADTVEQTLKTLGTTTTKSAKTTGATKKKAA